MFDRANLDDRDETITTEILTTTGEEVCLPCVFDVTLWTYADGEKYGEAHLKGVKLGGLQLDRQKVEEAFDADSISGLEHMMAERGMDHDAPMHRTFAAYGGAA